MDLHKFQFRFVESIKTATNLDWIQGINEHDRMTRLQIYSRGARIRFLEALKEDFSVCEKLMGPSVFRKLINNYIDLFPSQVTSLNEYSRDFPKLISQKYGAQSWQSHLSLFEWNLQEVHFGNNPTNITLDSSRMLKINSPLKLLSSDWTLAKAYRYQNIPTKDGKVHHFLFYINGSKSYFDTLKLWQAQVINDLLSTKSLDIALGLLAESDPRVPLNEVKRFFKTWAQRGVFEAL